MQSWYPCPPTRDTGPQPGQLGTHSSPEGPAGRSYRDAPVQRMKWAFGRQDRQAVGTIHGRKATGGPQAPLSFKTFLMWTIFKVFLKFAKYCFCFIFWFFEQEACRILAPRPGIKPTPPALKDKILTTGPSGKSPQCILSSGLSGFCRASLVTKSEVAQGTQSPTVGLSCRLRGSAPPGPQEARGTSARNHGNTQHLRTSPPLPVYLLGTTFEIFSYS